MIKKLLYIIFILAFVIISPVFSADFKITNIKADYSENAILFNGTTQSLDVKYTAGFSQNPLRAYIDLDNCIFIPNKKTIELKNNPIKKIAIAQYSANPNKVRVVFYADKIEDLQKIKLIKSGHTLTFKLKDFSYQATKIPIIFSDVLPKEYTATAETSIADSKYSKYILTDIHEGSAGLLFSGIGTVKLSRPFILTNPIRIVFDMQNATAQYKSLYGEHLLTNGDSIKIGQFNNNTLRFVVTTNNPVFYKSFLSPDLQSVYLVNANEMKEPALPNTNIPSTIKKINLKQTSPTETYITIDFDMPVIHALRKTYNKFLIDFLNVDYEKNAELIQTPKTAQFEGFTAEKMNETSDKLSLLFPVNDSIKVETGMTQDGKTIAIKLTSTATVTNTQKQTTPVKQNTNLPLKNKVIVVDAGHGGKDAGAVSGKKYEKVSALSISKMVQKNLEEKGATVIMTRKDDTFISLQDRVSISNYDKADLFVSIHLNSCEKSNIHGIETHWYKDNSKELAQLVQNELMKNIKAVDRGLFKSMFYVINHTTAPAILVETGFISNPQERDELFTESRQKATAKAISDGITLYFSKRKK